MRFFVAIFVVVLVIAGLIYSAVSANAKSVVTVNELVTAGVGSVDVRLGARVSEEKIDFTSTPEPKLTFFVKDIVNPLAALTVVYYGMMPDTLKSGRDVIVEGHYDGQVFTAKSLMTQCPSKYEPPNLDSTKPGAASSY